MSKFKISQDEKEFADDTLDGFTSLLEEIERCKQFKVGDYLIAKWPPNGDEVSGDVLLNTSYKTPEKFVVVYANKDGIPFYKRLDANSKPVGRMVVCVCPPQDGVVDGSEYYMELDPDYADAIILDSKADFNPSMQRKLKADLYKEITKYNKGIKVDTKDKASLEKILGGLTPGDILYKSATTFYTVQNTERMTRRQAEAKYGYKFRGMSSGIPTHVKLAIVHVVDSKGKSKILSSCLWDITYSNLYIDKPRSYKELKDQ